ncbi:MAG: hypothetical protein LC708_02985, partial [Actinobacteria bacterium]|nr:hypothetical protein [Actinomycetota bacterium]
MRTVSYNYAVGNNPLVSTVADPAGTITTTTDLLGRVTSYTDATGRTTTTTYDRPGRVTDTSGPQGTIHVAPDAAGRPVTQSLDGAVVATASYTAAGGELSTVTYGNGTKLGDPTPIARDQAGRTTGLTFSQANGSALVTDIVVRSQSGRVRDEAIDGTDANATSGDGGANFRYDGAGRLTEARVPTKHLTYGFSATNGCGLATTGRNANRTSMTVNGGTPTTYCYDSADRLTSSSDAAVGTPVYDGHGNTTTLGTQTLGYDPANRHLSTTAGPTNVSYTRDATDRIISRTENGATTGYGFAGPGDSPAFTTGLLGIVVDRFVSLVGGVTLTKRGAGDTWSYPNVHGDVVATANASGAKQGSTLSYDPYGVTLGPVPDNSNGNFDFGWLGQHQRGLEHAPGVTPTVEMGARPYVPSVGRFLESDPVEGGSANDYDYVNGDPVNGSDLDGNYSCSAGASSTKRLAKFNAADFGGGNRKVYLLCGDASRNWG